MADMLDTKFKIGQEVAIKCSRGYTGTIIMIDNYNHKYLLDCRPGALGCYEWLWLRNEKGEPHLYAANWLREEDLEEIG